MITVDVVLDDTHLRALELAMASIEDVIAAYVRQDLVPAVEALADDRLGEAPGAVHYPIEWTSEKQRMAFFATDGFGHGIPYQRNEPGIESQWEVTTAATDDATAVLLGNENPAARWVYGDADGADQQRMHINTGWPTFADEAAAIAQEAADSTARDFWTAFDRLINEVRP